MTTALNISRELLKNTCAEVSERYKESLDRYGQGEIRNILIAEDDKNLQDIFRGYCNHLAYQVSIISTVSETIKAIQLNKFDFLILDEQLKDGLASSAIDTIIRYVKKIIFITASNTKARRLRELMIEKGLGGIIDIYEKPECLDFIADLLIANRPKSCMVN